MAHCVRYISTHLFTIIFLNSLSGTYFCNIRRQRIWYLDVRIPIYYALLFAFQIICQVCGRVSEREVRTVYVIIVNFSKAGGTRNNA